MRLEPFEKSFKNQLKTQNCHNTIDVQFNKKIKLTTTNKL